VTSNTTRQKRQRQPSDASGASKPAARSGKRPRSENSPAATVAGGDGAAGSGAALPAGLHIVATPIGNIADITLRALDVLRTVDVIACEDTRVTSKLTARYGIATRRLAYNDHNAERVRPQLLARLRRGERVALVSDAGTPLISDPGYKLVQAAIDEQLPVTFVPGAAAPLAALALSGLPADRFLFAGFPPPRQAARRRVLAELAAVPATLILFESPRRLAESLADMADILGERGAAVARELTKRHEEVRRDTLAALARHYAQAGAPRGEIVIVIGPPDVAAADAAEGEAVLDSSLRTALAGASLRDAAAAVAAATGLPRRQVYARALALMEEDKKR
jgi:16S rRNA (cytidine1402-2'-O)-methyltransferase